MNRPLKYAFIGSGVVFFVLLVVLLLVEGLTTIPANIISSYPVSVAVHVCQDCTLAPIDKVYALPTDYIPNVVATNLPGNGKLTSESRDALAQLIADAKSVNLQIVIVSAYRSYADQEQVFAGWVDTEMRKGLSREAAEKEANGYSAKSGHSEHQLGTTVDVSCAGCEAFMDSAGNLAVYQYLEQSAYKFGFAISYPRNSQELTGYKYEPWHIRYIGTDLATELFNSGYLSGNGNYLAKFLREKGLY